MAPVKRYRTKTNTLYVKKDLWKQMMHFNPIRIDDYLFRMHYKLSVLIVLFVYLTYSRVLYKYGVLNCIFPSGGTNNEVMDTACFAVSVYSIDFNQRDIPMINQAFLGGRKTPSDTPPGVIMGFEELDLRKDVRYHKYYQFTPFILLVQIILFVIPRYFWRCFEAGKICMMVKDLDGPVLDTKVEKYQNKIKQIGEYFVACLGTNTYYAFVYTGCELLNMVGVVFQLYFLDAVTSNVFSTHGLDALSYMMDGYKRGDPFSIGFPTLANCTFNQYGPGGNNIAFSGVCALPLNLVTKGYIAWFWVYLMALTILSGINIGFRILKMRSSQRRMQTIKDYSIVQDKVLQRVMKNCMYGDWFILKLLAENLDTSVFNDILVKINNHLVQHKVKESNV